MSARLAVVVALEQERIALRRALAASGRESEIFEIFCGMGAERARLATRQSLAGPGAPELTGVLVAGFAGGVDPDLRAGDVVVASSVLDLGKDGEPRELACAAGELLGDFPATRGRIASVSTPVTNIEDKAAIWREHRAAAVDMESAAVLEVAEELGLPAACVRVIIDDARTPLVEGVEEIVDEFGRARPLALMARCARRPGTLGELMRLAPVARRAKRGLVEVFSAVPRAG